MGVVVGVVSEGMTLGGTLAVRVVNKVVVAEVVCEGVMVEGALGGRMMYVREGQGVVCEGVTLGGALIGRVVHVEVVQGVVCEGVMVEGALGGRMMYVREGQGVVCEGVMVEGALQRACSQQTYLCGPQEGSLQLDATQLLQRTSPSQTVRHCCPCD